MPHVPLCGGGTRRGSGFAQKQVAVCSSSVTLVAHMSQVEAHMSQTQARILEQLTGLTYARCGIEAYTPSPCCQVETRDTSSLRSADSTCVASVVSQNRIMPRERQHQSYGYTSVMCRDPLDEHPISKSFQSPRATEYRYRAAASGAQHARPSRARRDLRLKLHACPMLRASHHAGYVQANRCRALTRAVAIRVPIFHVACR